MDARFARLKTDPRFRRPKKEKSQVVVDDRFKEIFDPKQKGKKTQAVDKYGRKVPNTQEQDNLRKFYRIQDAEQGEQAEEAPAVLDYARGEVLLESSDEEDSDKEPDEDSEDEKAGPVHGSDVEVDLDESTFAELDAQAAAYSSQNAENQPTGRQTRRIAVVNLDWDHVRASHLYKIFSSLVSSSAPAVASSSSTHPERQRSIKGGPSNVARGKVVHVSVYPSEFGAARIAREETEGPPPEVFKRNQKDADEEVNEQNIYEVGGAEDEYDEDALRKYQLERLRYYFAIVECDTVDAASHIYAELEGTELERSANIFDLSYVPDGMTFDQKPRDEASRDETATSYKGIDFVTDALRHSKVKLTWDQDDAEREQVTRRTLTKQEIDDGDFRAYLASSGSESSDNEEDPKQKKAAPTKKSKKDKKASRDKLRSLLLGGEDDELLEGWGREDDAGGGGDVDMEITFTPGLSESKGEENETTLEAYQRKMKNKKKRRKEENLAKSEAKDKANPELKNGKPDEFFEVESDQDEEEKEEKKSKGRKKAEVEPAEPRTVSTPQELALLVTSDNPNADPKHFNLKAVIKAEKKSKLKGKRAKKAAKGEDEGELQEDFTMDVKDDRFAALHDDHTFAIDPSHPQFKKTKSMAALLDERSKRQKNARGEDGEGSSRAVPDAGRSLQSLVESVKRKSAIMESGNGKRRKL